MRLVDIVKNAFVYIMPSPKYFAALSLNHSPAIMSLHDFCSIALTNYLASTSSHSITQ